MTIEKIKEITQDNQVDVQEAKDLNNIVRTNIIEGSNLSQKIEKNITPDLVKGILYGIDQSIKSQETIDTAYKDLLKGLNMYIGDNADIKNMIQKLESFIDNKPILDQRKELQRKVNEPLMKLSELNSKLLSAYFVFDVATTSETQQVALDKIKQLFSDAPDNFADIKDFLQGKQKDVGDFQTDISTASNAFNAFNKEHPVASVEHSGGSISGLRKYIGDKLSSVDTNTVFNSSLKGIKSSRLKDFLNKQQNIIKNLPDDQVVSYVKSLEQKIGELKNNKNLTSDDVTNLENIFTDIFKDINSYTNQNAIEVPQISKQEYLGKDFSEGLFSQSEYRNAYEQSFDEENSVLAANAVEYTKLGISNLFEKNTLKEITFTPYFVTIGKSMDGLLQDDPELSSYPIGTRMLVVIPMDKDNKELVFKEDIEENNGKKYKKLVKATEGITKTQRTYILFGENSAFSDLKGQKFADSYQRVDGKDKLNGQDFDVLKSDGTIDLQQFDVRGEKAFSTWLSKQSDDVFKENPGLITFLNTISGYTNKSDGNKTEAYKSSFFTSFTTELVSRAPHNNKLFADYVDLITKNFNLLGNNLASQKKNHALLEKFIQENKWLESSDQAQKEMAIKIGSLKLLFQEKSEPKTFENTIKTYAKMLFSHPIGQMLLGLFDTFFGGKGGFLKKFGNMPGLKGISESINTQFKEKYELKGEQLELLQNIYGSGFSTTPEVSFDNYKQDFLKVQDSFLKDQKFTDFIEQFKNNPKLLDVNVLAQYFPSPEKILKTKDRIITFGEVFQIGDDKQLTIKDNIDQTILENVLTSIVVSEKAQATVSQADIMIKDKKMDLGNGSQKGIQSQADYAVFLGAYLMGGSKAQKGDFHYVITETRMPNEGKWQGPIVASSIQPEKPERFPEKKIFMEKIDKIENELRKKISNGKYDGKYLIANYSYDNSDVAEQKSYQDNILKPIKELFDNTKTEGVEKTNFELLLDIYKTEKHLGEGGIKDLIHFKNMFIYMNEGKTTDQLIGKDVIENITKMSKIETDDQKIIYSNTDGDKIELSCVDNKIKTTYTTSKVGQEAAVQEKA